MTYEIFRTYWKEAMAYRAEFMLTLVTAPLRFIVIVMIWSAVYTQNSLQEVKGYSLSNLITYFIISSFIFIFMYNQFARNLSKEVKFGDFLVNLLKPIHYVKLFLYKTFARRIFAIVIELMPMIAIIWLFFSDYFVLGNVFLYLLSIALAFFIYFFIWVCVGTLAFWFVEIRSFVWLFNFFVEFAAGMFVPLDLLPQLIQRISDFLPFKYIGFVPVSMYLGNYSTSFADGFSNTIYFHLMMAAFWIAVLYLLAMLMWKLAIKRFNGVGA